MFRKRPLLSDTDRLRVTAEVGAVFNPRTGTVEPSITTDQLISTGEDSVVVSGTVSFPCDHDSAFVVHVNNGPGLIAGSSLVDLDRCSNPSSTRVETLHSDRFGTAIEHIRVRPRNHEISKAVHGQHRTILITAVVVVIANSFPVAVPAAS